MTTAEKLKSVINYLENLNVDGLETDTVKPLTRSQIRREIDGQLETLREVLRELNEDTVNEA